MDEDVGGDVARSNDNVIEGDSPYAGRDTKSGRRFRLGLQRIRVVLSPNA